MIRFCISRRPILRPKQDPGDELIELDHEEGEEWQPMWEGSEMGVELGASTALCKVQSGVGPLP